MVTTVRADTGRTPAPRVLVIGPEMGRVDAVAERISSMGFSCDTALASPTSLRGGLLHAPDVVVALEVGGTWQPARRLLEIDGSQAGVALPPVLVIAEGMTQEERADTLATQPTELWDWVDLPCPDREIEARLRRLSRIQLMDQEIRFLTRRCAETAMVDQLTGLPNHRAFQTSLAAEFRRAERYGSPLTLVLMDLDRFRSFNDEHGHECGDRLLRATASLLRSVVRDADQVARYGGEEFALLLPETTADAALAAVRRLQEGLGAVVVAIARDAEPPALSESTMRVTFSAGLATHPSDATSTQGSLLAAAEAALRRAKDEGRNRAVVHGSTGAAAGPSRTSLAAGSSDPRTGSGGSG